MATLDETLGALEVGIILSIFLYGVFSVQVFLYTQTNSNDAFWLKLLVFIVWAFETAHSFCICIVLYNLTVTHYGFESTIADAPFSLDFSAVISAWIGAIIQAFFAYRVKVISGRLLIPIISWTLSVLRACFGVMIGVNAFRSGTLPHFIEEWDWLVIAEFTLCAVIDVLNTASICYYLLKRRSHFKSSKKLVDRIILFSIETGLLTSITVLAMLSCALAMPHNLIYVGILMPYAKMFSNSFMTSLNARHGLRNSSSLSDPQSNSLSAGRATFSGVYVQPVPFTERNRTVALELPRIDVESGKAYQSPARHHHDPPNSFEGTESTASGKLFQF